MQSNPYSLNLTLSNHALADDTFYAHEVCALWSKNVFRVQGGKFANLERAAVQVNMHFLFPPVSLQKYTFFFDRVNGRCARIATLWAPMCHASAES
jgi:hypothetical protein